MQGSKHMCYQYQHITTGDEIAEYHIDAFTTFQEQMNEETDFGGRLSIRIDPNTKLVMLSEF